MEGQLMMQRHRVKGGIDIGSGQQRLGIGGKAERVRGATVIQRLDAQPVAG